MRKILFASACLFVLFTKQESIEEYAYQINLISSQSIFGIEDKDGRIAYERLLTVNPKTNTIPFNVRQKELLFAKKKDVNTSQFRTNSLDVESIGPTNVGGRTRAIALDVRNEDIIIAGGVSGGIWKSIDGGLSWLRKSDPENRNSVTCLVQDTRPGREDTWYHGTGEIVGNSTRGGSAPFRGNGIYKSTDNGETWNVLPSTVDSGPEVFNSQFQYIWNMQINEQNLEQDELIVAAFGGILKTLDGGETWQVEIGQELFNLADSVNLNDVNASFYTDIEQTPEGVFYATLSTVTAIDEQSPDAGIYASNDADTWFRITPISLSQLGYRRIVMGSATLDPGICYFLADAGEVIIARYKLNDFSESGPTGEWNGPLEVPSFEEDLGRFDTQGSYNLVIKVDPTNDSTVFAGGTNLYRSTDGFNTQESIDWVGGYDPAGGTNVYPNHHPDQHEMIFFPSDPDKMLSMNDGGIRLTRDFNADTVVWESRNNGYQTSQFFTIALSQEAGDNSIIGGMQDNGTDFSTGSQSWSGLIGGDGSYTEIAKGKSLWFASFQNGQSFSLTLDEGLSITSFARIDPGGLVDETPFSYLFINPFIVDPVNPNRVFVAGGGFVYFNDNISQIPSGTQDPADEGWVRLVDTELDSSVYSALDMSIDGTVVYAGSSGGRLFKITNANELLSQEVEEVSSVEFPEDGYVSAISVNPDDANHIMVVFSNYEIPSVFESQDGGRTFQDISGDLEENADGTGSGPSVRWGELIPLNDGTLYVVGTSTGLYSTEDVNGNKVWSKESGSLIGNAVITMMDYRAIDGRLAIATHGNGVFITNVDNYKEISSVNQTEEQFGIVATYPNPFKDKIMIRYSIPNDGQVKIDLFSSKGELIRNLLWAPQFSGENSITWDGRNAAGGLVTNGIYLYRISYEGKTISGRISIRK